MEWEIFWSSLIGTIVPVVIGIAYLASKLEQVRHIRETCQERKKDHEHHYTRINEHSVQIGSIDTRVKSLEDWRRDSNFGITHE